MVYWHLPAVAHVVMLILCGRYKKLTIAMSNMCHKKTAQHWKSTAQWRICISLEVRMYVGAAENLGTSHHHVFCSEGSIVVIQEMEKDDVGSEAEVNVALLICPHR